jgi:hypothetical protein
MRRRTSSHAGGPSVERDPAWRWVPPYEETFGDLAAGLAVELGMVMDAEQRMVLDAIFAESAPGVPTCFEVAAIAPRQNLKTATLEIAALTDVFLLDVRLHVWTAHLFRTARAAFEDMVRLIDGNDDFRKRCKKPRTANGDEAIELLTGQRIEFHARSKGGGRGLTGGRVTLDEGLFLAPAETGSLLPILATRRDAQVRYGSSAGLATSAVLRRLRDRGRRGSDPRLAWFEWCAPEDARCVEPLCAHEVGTVGCVLDREDLWQVANPALGRRIDVDTLRAFRRSMDAGEFAREFLGWWDDPSDTEPAFGAGFWEACASTAGPSGGFGALGLAVTVDGTRGCIGAASVDAGVGHVKPLQHGPGTGWMVERAAELQSAHGVPVVLDGGGPAAVLIPHLEQAGVDVRVLETREVLDACAGIFEWVRERRVRHQGYVELDEAVSGAVKRTVGDRWAWGRRKSSADISPLEAVTFALHATRLRDEDPESVYESRDLLTL